MKHVALLTIAFAASSPASGQEPDASASGSTGRPPGGPAVQLSGETATCLACHADKSLAITLKSGEELSLFVDAAMLSRSRHGKNGCTDCHTDLKGAEGGHPRKPLPSARELVVEYAKECAGCHVENGERMKDSVHQLAQERGDLQAATCTDCHGAHDARRLKEPRANIARTCARCHGEIAQTFSKSVHGAALSDGNPDVPTCTDCHASHAIKDPRGATWRLGLPDLCGTCHSDAAKMKKYHLSPNVLQTYLADFHGNTVSLLKAQKTQPVVALCTDCHGVHDIAKTHDPESRVVAANLVHTCRKCHPQANESFPKAWMSHYQPSWDKAPLVWSMNFFYRLFIPFVICGLVLQIGLHLRKSWRLPK
jgi:predicted CXXCH cytochrome family protein